MYESAGKYTGKLGYRILWCPDLKHRAGYNKKKEKKWHLNLT